MGIKFKEGNLKDIEDFIKLLDSTAKEVNKKFVQLSKQVNKLKTKFEKIQNANN